MTDKNQDKQHVYKIYRNGICVGIYLARPVIPVIGDVRYQSLVEKFVGDEEEPTQISFDKRCKTYGQENVEEQIQDQITSIVEQVENCGTKHSINHKKEKADEDAEKEKLHLKIKEMLIESGCDEVFANNLGAHIVNTIIASANLYQRLKDKGADDSVDIFVEVAYALFNKHFNDGIFRLAGMDVQCPNENRFDMYR